MQCIVKCRGLFCLPPLPPYCCVFLQLSVASFKVCCVHFKKGKMLFWIEWSLFNLWLKHLKIKTFFSVAVKDCVLFCLLSFCLLGYSNVLFNLTLYIWSKVLNLKSWFFLFVYIEFTFELHLCRVRLEMPQSLNTRHVSSSQPNGVISSQERTQTARRPSQGMCTNYCI